MPRTRKGEMRTFLVILDDSRECLNAMRYAALRAGRTGSGVEILSIIPPEEFQHWIGVGDMMREEARDRIHAHFEVFAKWMRDKHQVEPTLAIREGEAVPAILERIREREEIGVLVLGAASGNNPGQLVMSLVKSAGTLPVPLTIVPADLSKDDLENLD